MHKASHYTRQFKLSVRPTLASMHLKYVTELVLSCHLQHRSKHDIAKARQMELFGREPLPCSCRHARNRPVCNTTNKPVPLPCLSCQSLSARQVSANGASKPHLPRRNQCCTKILNSVGTIASLQCNASGDPQYKAWMVWAFH